jgi:NADPH:quinone reductase-like Zn-dependent oxidoreductase
MVPASVFLIDAYSYTQQPAVIAGLRQYPIAFPLTFGTCCVGHVEEVGPDVTSLQPGMLVFCDYIVHLRDAPEERIVLGESRQSNQRKPRS